MSLGDPSVPPELPRSWTTPPVRPWGLWMTLAWGVLVALAFLGAQTMVVILFAVPALTRGEKLDISSFAARGDVLAFASCAGSIVAIAILVLAACLRRGIRLQEYFAFRWPPMAALTRWSIVFVAYVVGTDLITYTLGKPIVPDVMIDTYRSAGWALPLLWLVVLVGAPLSEELFFRGFLFAGLQESRLGVAGAILIPATLWASIHLQYDLYGIIVIFFGGVLLGLARARTSSLWICIFLHCLMNLVSTIQLLVRISRSDQ